MRTSSLVLVLVLAASGCSAGSGAPGEPPTTPTEGPTGPLFDACESPAFCKSAGDPVHTVSCSITAGVQTLTADSSGSCGEVNALASLQVKVCAAKAQVTQAEWDAAKAGCLHDIDPCRHAQRHPCSNDVTQVTCTLTKDDVTYRETGPMCGNMQPAADTAIMKQLCDAHVELTIDELRVLECAVER